MKTVFASIFVRLPISMLLLYFHEKPFTLNILLHVYT